MKILVTILFTLGLCSLTFGQGTFKIWKECKDGCDKPTATDLHFDYGTGFQIIARFGSDAGITVDTESMRNDAPTLTPVFKSYCNAWADNNEAALRQAYSAETVRFFEAQMKVEKTKTLLKYLGDTDRVSPDFCEVRNEVLLSDIAFAVIRARSFPNGIHIKFVKENGIWKLTNKSPVMNRYFARSTFLISENGKSFVNRVGHQKIDRELNEIFLQVYNLASYCIQHNITGLYSEVDKFAPLSDLKRYIFLRGL
jgi:hypothetical protein